MFGLLRPLGERLRDVFSFSLMTYLEVISSKPINQGEIRIQTETLKTHRAGRSPMQLQPEKLLLPEEVAEMLSVSRITVVVRQNSGPL